MKNHKIFTMALLILLYTLIACTNNTKDKAGQEPIDPRQEIAAWKLELLENHLIGEPCNYALSDFDSLNIKNWISENPNQIDGLPTNEEEYKSIKADFNKDNQEDVLLYFTSNNCTGHNGGSKTFAKIIYSDRSIKLDLMKDIQSSIVQSYNIKKNTDKNLKEVCDSYLETTTTIDAYQNAVKGHFKLYTLEDPHCCPSYKGRYTYSISTHKMDIEIDR